MPLFLSIITEEEFQKTQQTFLEKYWKVFEPIEENKLVYMDVFEEYVSCWTFLT